MRQSVNQSIIGHSIIITRFCTRMMRETKKTHARALFTRTRHKHRERRKGRWLSWTRIRARASSASFVRGGSSRRRAMRRGVH